jgi:hypothetical protein
VPPSIAQVAADRFRKKVLRLFGLDRESRDSRRIARGRRHLQQGAEEVGMTFEEAEEKGLVNWETPRVRPGGAIEGDMLLR